MTKILMVDDDERLGNLLKTYLERFGFELHTASDCEKGLAKLSEIDLRAIILDVMLPGPKDGFETFKSIRTIAPNLPVLFLSARCDLADKVLGLELGADDYLAKPFEPRELAARLTTITRREKRNLENQTLKVSGMIEYENLRILLESREVFADEKMIELTALEYDALVFLAKNPGVTFSRELISETLRGTNCGIDDRSIDMLVSKLRNKLGDKTKIARFIKTIWGSGYMFVGTTVSKDVGRKKKQKLN
jgi:DNA-binding response OmpR family regulator